MIITFFIFHIKKFIDSLILYSHLLYYYIHYALHKIQTMQRKAKKNEQCKAQTSCEMKRNEMKRNEKRIVMWEV